MELFGIKFGKGSEKKVDLKSFEIDRDTGADVVVPEGYAGGDLNTFNMFGFQNQNDEYTLISNYRELAASSEVDEALQEIRNEIFIFDVPDKQAIELEVSEDHDIPKNTAKKIVQEFNNLYEIVEFDHKGIQYFDDWYVDGKLFVYKIVDSENPKNGIQKIQIIDPFQIRKVNVLPRPEADGTFNAAEIKEFYSYSNFNQQKYPLNSTIKIFHGQTIQGLQLSPESVTYVHSGHYDRAIGRYVGYLKKAIVPYNNLKMMEDAMVIFRVVRAPSRRAIYIDVAGLQKNKAEEYIKSMMANHRNKMTYDAKTGTLSDRRNVLSMMEDYWFPRRTEGRTTEVQTLEGQNVNDILEEVNYNRDKLWRALNVPRGRFGEQSPTFVFGKSTEIQRDEYRFKRYLNLLRSRFIVFFEDLLKTQLILKKVISEDDWEAVRKSLKWKYTEDNAFVEYKETEILRNRLDNLSAVEGILGKFRSNKWAMKTILKMTDEEIEEETKQIEKEKAAGEAHDVDVEVPDQKSAKPSREEPEQFADSQEDESEGGSVSKKTIKKEVQTDE